MFQAEVVRNNQNILCLITFLCQSCSLSAVGKCCRDGGGHRWQ